MAERRNDDGSRTTRERAAARVLAQRIVETAGRVRQRAGSSDLKQREYRDKEGDVHHHTHEYIERHGKQGGSGLKRS